MRTWQLAVLLGVIAVSYVVMVTQLGRGDVQDNGLTAALLSCSAVAMALGGLLVRKRRWPSAVLFTVVVGASALSVPALLGGDPFALAGVWVIQGATGVGSLLLGCAIWLSQRKRGAEPGATADQGRDVGPGSS